MDRLHIPLNTLETRYLDHHRARNHSPRTIERYRETFRDLHRFLEATGRPTDSSVLTGADLSAFGSWLRTAPKKPWRGSTERSVYTIHARLKDVRAFCILSDEQLQMLFSCRHLASPGPQAVRNRALVALLLDTGMRLSEANGICLADLDLDNHLLKVRGKGNKERIVVFQTGAAGYLRAWLAVRGDEDGELFWLKPRGIQMLFTRIRRETGLPIHTHLLRHQSATLLVRANTDLHTVKRLLGHRQLSTVEKYLSLTTTDLAAKHAAASPFETVRHMMAPESPKPRRKRLGL
ncbi:MAG: tyrosine-type recombinase/integrase [Chloroflexota bacterium]|nr:tyrosine-type recombinase/integrase [Chloroflexota bacterium]